ncbi:MAG: PepSY domain-containing protein [Pseudomonadota bacterium]
MTRHKKQSRARLLKSLYMWHRWIGLTAAAFVAVLSVTGLLLNHTGELALDSQHVHSPVLLDWYGVQVPDEMRSFTVGQHVVTQVGDSIYWDTTLIPQLSAKLIGAVDFPEFVVAAVEGELLLFTHSGELVERLGGAAGVPAGMQAVGISPRGTLAIHAAHGFYQTDDMFLEWQETDTLEAEWMRAGSPAPELRAALEQAYRGTGLSLERVLLDLHSGRILGSGGIYVVDAAAILFLLLAISGIWLWGKRRAGIRAHQQGKHARQP